MFKLYSELNLIFLGDLKNPLNRSYPFPPPKKKFHGPTTKALPLSQIDLCVSENIENCMNKIELFIINIMQSFFLQVPFTVIMTAINVLCGNKCS